MFTFGLTNFYYYYFTFVYTNKRGQSSQQFPNWLDHWELLTSRRGRFISQRAPKRGHFHCLNRSIDTVHRLNFWDYLCLSDRSMDRKFWDMADKRSDTLPLWLSLGLIHLLQVFPFSEVFQFSEVTVSSISWPKNCFFIWILFFFFQNSYRKCILQLSHAYTRRNGRQVRGQTLITSFCEVDSGINNHSNHQRW